MIGSASLMACRECHECGLVQTVSSPVPGMVAGCERCGTILMHPRVGTNLPALALALTSLVLYCIAVFAPFISVSIVGQVRDTTLISLPAAFAEDGMWELGAAVMLTAIVLPGVKIAAVVVTLLGLLTAKPPSWLPIAFRQYHLIGPWAMVEVFLLGVFVAYTRLGSIATVHVGGALYSMAALLLTTVLTDYLIDREAVWEELGGRGLGSNGNAAQLATTPSAVLRATCSTT